MLYHTAVFSHINFSRDSTNGFLEHREVGTTLSHFKINILVIMWTSRYHLAVMLWYTSTASLLHTLGPLERTLTQGFLLFTVQTHTQHYTPIPLSKNRTTYCFLVNLKWLQFTEMSGAFMQTVPTTKCTIQYRAIIMHCVRNHTSNLCWHK